MLEQIQLQQIYIGVILGSHWLGGSKRQGCVSHSTPEAEIIAADYALRTHAIPVISLWKTLVGQGPKIIFHDENQGDSNNT